MKKKKLKQNKINQLLNAEIKDIDSANYFLSIYFPNQLNKELLIKKLKSLILTQFKNHQTLGKDSRLAENIFKTLVDKINHSKDLKQGLAFFIQFNAKKSQRSDFIEQLEEDSNIFFLKTEPEKNFYLGKYFQLSQLMLDQYKQDKTLIIHWSQAKAQIYNLEINNISLLSELENKHIIKQEDEYLEKHAPNKNKATIYSTGADITDRRRSKQNELFTNNLIKKLEKIYQYKFEYDFLIIFHSHNFDQLIDNFKNNFDYTYQLKGLSFKNKNYQRENELLAASIKVKQNLEKQYLQAIIKDSQDNKLFIDNWQDITKASRALKIDKLFIKPKIKKTGYIKNWFLYTYPVKGSKKIKNLSPWIIRNVKQNNGEILPLTKELTDEKLKIAARLRY